LIDFRYHLISLIAVFLALALGILMGSVVLDDRLVERLQDRVSETITSNGDLRARINDLDGRLTAFEEFATEAELPLVGNTLLGRTVVLIEVEGTDGTMVDDVRGTIERAGGEVATTLVLTERFALRDQTERDQLALILGSSSESARDLQTEIASALGGRMAAAAKRDAERGGAVNERFETLMDELRENDFVGVDSGEDSALVPAGTVFLFLAGADGEPEYNAVPLTLALANSLADNGAPTLMAGITRGTWGFVDAFRNDGKAQAQISTVDNADTVPGRIAVALALEEASRGLVGHYGQGPGAEQALPEVSSGG
jgi:hypothetical protein